MTLRYSKLPSQRQMRVAQQIKEELSLQLLKLYHPLLEKAFITISEVRVSPDLKVATAFFTSYSQENIKEITTILNRFAISLRKQLACKLSHMKYCPTLTFHFDKSFDDFAKVQSMLLESNM